MSVVRYLDHKYLSLGLISLTILSVCLFSSCVDKDDHNVFSFNVSKGINTLDPHQVRTQEEIWVALQLYNTLVALDTGLHVVPSLAKSWKVEEEGKSYTFTIRDDVLLTNHKEPKAELTAHHVAASFQRLMDPAQSAKGTWIFASLIGSPDSAFTATNDSTFIIRLRQPNSTLLSQLTLPYAAVVVDEEGALFGTGPFTKAAYYQNEKLLLRNNPLYWEEDENGESLHYLEGVEISFINSKQNEYLAFLQGKLHMLSGLDASYKDEVLSRDGTFKDKFKKHYIASLEPFLNTEYLAFYLPDTIKKGFDRNFRKGIELAINSRKILDYLRNGAGTPANGYLLPEKLLSYREHQVQHNLEEARALYLFFSLAEGEEANRIIYSWLNILI